jgi:hypothetical protein
MNVQMHFPDGWGILVDEDSGQIVDHGFEHWDAPEVAVGTVEVKRPVFQPRPPLYYDADGQPVFG